MAYFIRNDKGRAHGLFGWAAPEFGLHYRTKEEAEAVRQQSPALASCTVEKVPPKLDAGMSKPATPIFSGGAHG